MRTLCSGRSASSEELPERATDLGIEFAIPIAPGDLKAVQALRGRDAVSEPSEPLISQGA